MTIWGKIVGGAAGLALGGPLGALIGVAAGHAVDRYRDMAAQDEGAADDATRQVAFTIAVIALGAKMAKADGRVSREEVAAFREVFHVPPDEVTNVARVFDQAKRSTAGFEAYARQIAAMFTDRPVVLEELLDALFHIAKADGGVESVEIEYLREVARIFGFDDRAFARLRESQLGPDAGDPYTILGVDRDADETTLKSAYRRAVRENHPDRLMAQGLPEEFIVLANEKLAAINAAYERARKERALQD